MPCSTGFFQRSSILLLALAPSCLPYVVPPARVSVGGATQSGRVLVDGETRARPNATVIRAGLHPLDVADKELPVDVGLGYQAELTSVDGVPTVQGMYLEVGAYPLILPLGERVSLRAGGYGAVEGLARSSLEDTGLGGTVGGMLELTGRVSSPYAGADSDGTLHAGFARGRWAVGLFGSGSVRNFGDGGYESATVGVSVRLPLLAGVVCCALPSLSHGGHGSSHSSSSSSSSGSDSSQSQSHRLVRTPASPRPKE
ncbi:MAG TPA: hypothetical protein VFQ61_18215 [Polyangiaceae bacterium]|nr:hypothetical protein [Polyangiaceae bacterium]